MDKKENTALPVIGVYTFCSTGSVLVHKIEGDRVLASINGKSPHWCDITDEWDEDEADFESGFYFRPDFFVPFSQTMRMEV